MPLLSTALDGLPDCYERDRARYAAQLALALAGSGDAVGRGSGGNHRVGAQPVQVTAVPLKLRGELDDQSVIDLLSAF